MATAEISKCAGILSAALSQHHLLGFEIAHLELLQDLLELTPKKDVLFIIGDWNAKVGSQETHWTTRDKGDTQYIKENEN